MQPFSKYWALFKAQVINALAYPGELAYRSLAIVLFMWVFAHLWGATYSALGQNLISGLSLHDTLWYLMLAETIMLSKPRLSSTVAEAVKDGSIAYLLNKPYNFLLYQISVGLGDSALRMVFNAIAGGAVIWTLVGAPPDARGYPFVLVTIALAWLIDFCLNAMIGLTAFVTEEIAAFEWIYSKILFLLGGLLIPLDFYPEWLRNIVQALPFAYTIYAPARLFVDPSVERFLNVVVLQIFWFVTSALALALLYRRGVTWLTINGG